MNSWGLGIGVYAFRFGDNMGFQVELDSYL